MPKTSWSGHRHHSHATDTDCSRRSRSYHRGIIGPNKPKLLYYLTSIKREITEIYWGNIFFRTHRLSSYIPTYRVHYFHQVRQRRKDYIRARKSVRHAFWSTHVAIDSAYRARLSCCSCRVPI